MSISTFYMLASHPDDPFREPDLIDRFKYLIKEPKKKFSTFYLVPYKFGQDLPADHGLLIIARIKICNNPLRRPNFITIRQATHKTKGGTLIKTSYPFTSLSLQLYEFIKIDFPLQKNPTLNKIQNQIISILRDQEETIVSVAV